MMWLQLLTGLKKQHEWAFSRNTVSWALMDYILRARGNPVGANRSLERALLDVNRSLRQQRGLLLAHLAIVAAGANRMERARQALEELQSDQPIQATPALAALHARSPLHWQPALSRRLSLMRSKNGGTSMCRDGRLIN